MNILVPDKWLREYLDTEAKPIQIKKYLSLCGPSVERIHKIKETIVYDIEVTSNRPDSMSIFGIAREAATILPRFGIKANLISNPNKFDKFPQSDKSQIKKLHIVSDPKLNPRWTSIVLTNITIKDSPEWLQEKLELSGIRPINNIVDITNYLMKGYGQPVHAFDYDEIKPKNKIPYMLLRKSKKNEKITTLDDKEHILPGGDIVIEDGSGRLIDLCGIMGAKNSSIKNTTKNIILFTQTYKSSIIRKTMMSLSHRSEAGSLFEKDLDPENTLPTLYQGIKIAKDIAGAKIASKITDIYESPFKNYFVSVSRTKLNKYLGIDLTNSQITDILKPLSLNPEITKNQITVKVPSHRRDIQIDVDIIEEVARIYGYHNIKNKLPDTEPPIVISNPILKWEEEIKLRLRDWGYTENFTYSMISDELMDIFDLDKEKVYQISNPISSEWVYMRPSLLPSLLEKVKQNINIKKSFKIFELSNIYIFSEGNLPQENPILTVIWTGNKFIEAKGLAESIFKIFGIKFWDKQQAHQNSWWQKNAYLNLDEFGHLGLINQKLLQQLSIDIPITVLNLNFKNLVSNACFTKKYIEIPKTSPIIEDLTFILPLKTQIGKIIDQITNVSKIITKVEFVNIYENAASFKIHYQDNLKSLSVEDILPIRKQIVQTIEKVFQAKLKGTI